MIDVDPKILMGVGFILMVLGTALPFLMVLQIIDSTLFLDFFSFGIGFLGLILGMIGVFTLAMRNRNRRR
jgi:hypothetical protein